MPRVEVEQVTSRAEPDGPPGLRRLRAGGTGICDIGAGDGKYAVRLARSRGDAVVVAIDAEATRLRDSARRLRGRAPDNLYFWVGSLDEPIPAAEGLFDEIHVVLPWGSLLAGMLGDDETVLGNVLRLGRPGARLMSVLNQRPWREGHHDRRTEHLPSPSDPGIEARVRALLERRGWRLASWAPMAGSDARRIESSWARRIASSQPPEFLRYEAVRGDAP